MRRARAAAERLCILAVRNAVSGHLAWAIARGVDSDTIFEGGYDRLDTLKDYLRILHARSLIRDTIYIVFFCTVCSTTQNLWLSYYNMPRKHLNLHSTGVTDDERASLCSSNIHRLDIRPIQCLSHLRALTPRFRCYCRGKNGPGSGGMRRSCCITAERSVRPRLRWRRTSPARRTGGRDRRERNGW